MIKKSKFVKWTMLLALVSALGTFLSVDVHAQSKGKAEGKPTSASTAKETDRDGRFIAYDNGTVLDTKTNLMWAAKDNGSNINWDNAKKYCENYSGGGYTDWRMPTFAELEGLYEQSKSYKATQENYSVHLTRMIQLSTCCPWTSETRGSEANYFHFRNSFLRLWAPKSFAKGPRALPVRAVK